MFIQRPIFISIIAEESVNTCKSRVLQSYYKKIL